MVFVERNRALFIWVLIYSGKKQDTIHLGAYSGKKQDTIHLGAYSGKKQDTIHLGVYSGKKWHCFMLIAHE